MNQQEFDLLEGTEQKVQLLADTVRGLVDSDTIDMEKTLSVRLGSKTYPMVKALASESEKSMNFIISELVSVGLDVLLKNFSDEERSGLNNQAHHFYNEWVKQIEEERGAK